MVEHKYKHKKKFRSGKIWDILNTGWTGAVFYIFLGILVAVSVHQASGMVLGTGLPIVTVSSPSMVPTLNVGDIVIIKGEETYQPGDIIVFNGWESEPIIHRAVALSYDEYVEKMSGWNELKDQDIANLAYGRGKIYITKGDNNPRCDQCANRLPVKEEDVYGKAMVKIPYLGWVKILVIEWFIIEPLFGIALVIILAIAYVIYKKLI